METMQKNLQEFFATMLEQKLEAKFTPLEAKLEPLATDLRDLRAQVDAIATDLEAVHARAPAAPPRDPVQDHVSGTSHRVLQLPTRATAETEDHLPSHVDQEFGPEYAHRGGEVSRGSRGVRHDGNLQFAPQGDEVPRGRDQVHHDIDGGHERCFRRDGDHYRDRRGHGDNFDLAYPPRGHELPHRLLQPHDDDAYHERPVRRDDAGCYDRRDRFHLKPPKHSFPVFKGQFPLLWIDNCYNYFEMYNVPDRHWVSTATLYFEDHAALWLQAYRRTHRQMNWDALITALVAEFGSDDYDGQMSSLLQLKQNGAVAEYKHKFESCMYHLLSVDAALNSKWFVSHFIHGLRDEFRAAVRLQHPASVTKAAHLAQIQEEEDDIYHRPQRALRDFRQANGLCFRCGDKYSREHKCKPPAQLLTIQVGACGEILSEDTVHALELLDEPTPAG